MDVPWGMSGVALHLQPLKFEGAEGGRRAQGDQYTRTADRQSGGKVRCGIGNVFRHRDRSPRGRRVDGVKLRPRVWTPLTQECERRTRPLVPLPPRSSRIACVDPNPKHSTLADTHATVQTPGSTCCKPFSPDVGIAVKDRPGLRRKRNVEPKPKPKTSGLGASILGSGFGCAGRNSGTKPVSGFL